MRPPSIITVSGSSHTQRCFVPKVLLFCIVASVSKLSLHIALLVRVPVSLVCAPSSCWIRSSRRRKVVAFACSSLCRAPHSSRWHALLAFAFAPLCQVALLCAKLWASPLSSVRSQLIGLSSCCAHFYSRPCAHKTLPCLSVVRVDILVRVLIALSPSCARCHSFRRSSHVFLGPLLLPMSCEVARV